MLEGQPTSEQLEANRRRKAFHASIAAKARKLQEDKLLRGLKAQHDLQPESFPAEPDPPKVVPPKPIIPFVVADRITVIQKAVAKAFGVSVIELQSARRSQDIVIARQAASYLAKTLTSNSFPEIGRSFGGRDHTTVLYACERMQAILDAPRGTGISKHWKASICDRIRDKIAEVRGIVMDIFPDLEGKV